MHPEGDKHLIEVCDNKDVLRILLPAVPQVFGQVHHREHRIPGLEDAFHRGMGMGHGLHRSGNHDLPHLGHVNAVQIAADGELHDLDLVGAGLQQNLMLAFFPHSNALPFIMCVSNNQLRTAIAAHTAQPAVHVKEQGPGHRTAHVLFQQADALFFQVQVDALNIPLPNIAQG